MTCKDIHQLVCHRRSYNIIAQDANNSINIPFNNLSAVIVYSGDNQHKSEIQDDKTQSC